MAVDHRRQVPHIHMGMVIVGSVFLAIGGARLLETTGLVDINVGRLIGPFVLIAIGVASLAGGRACRRDADATAVDVTAADPTRRPRGGEWFGGVWLVGLGCWLLVSQTGMFGIGFATSWPLLLIFLGALIAIRGWR